MPIIDQNIRRSSIPWDIQPYPETSAEVVGAHLGNFRIESPVRMTPIGDILSFRPRPIYTPKPVEEWTGQRLPFRNMSWEQSSRLAYGHWGVGEKGPASRATADWLGTYQDQSRVDVSKASRYAARVFHNLFGTQPVRKVEASISNSVPQLSEATIAAVTPPTRAPFTRAEGFWRHRVDRLVPRYSDSFSRYQSSQYSIINKILRRGKLPFERSDPLHRSEFKVLIGTIRDLKEATTRHIFRDEQLVYRGLPRRNYSNLNIGDILTEDAFVSTSQSRDVASYFSERGDAYKGSLWKVTLPKGTRGAPIYVHGMEDRGEREILLPPGSRFRLTGRSVGQGGVSELEFEHIPISEPYRGRKSRRLKESVRVSRDIANSHVGPGEKGPASRDTMPNTYNNKSTVNPMKAALLAELELAVRRPKKVFSETLDGVMKKVFDKYAVSKQEVSNWIRTNRLSSKLRKRGVNLSEVRQELQAAQGKSAVIPTEQRVFLSRAEKKAIINKDKRQIQSMLSGKEYANKIAYSDMTPKAPKVYGKKDTILHTPQANVPNDNIDLVSEPSMDNIVQESKQEATISPVKSHVHVKVVDGPVDMGRLDKILTRRLKGR